MSGDLRRRIEALESRMITPRLVREDDHIGPDRDVIEAEAMLDQAEAEMMADRSNPTLRSHWLDCARNLDAAKNRATDRRRDRLPAGSILLQYRHEHVKAR